MKIEINVNVNKEVTNHEDGTFSSGKVYYSAATRIYDESLPEDGVRCPEWLALALPGVNLSRMGVNPNCEMLITHLEAHDNHAPSFIVESEFMTYMVRVENQLMKVSEHADDFVGKVSLQAFQGMSESWPDGTYSEMFNDFSKSHSMSPELAGLNEFAESLKALGVMSVVMAEDDDTTPKVKPAEDCTCDPVTLSIMENVPSGGSFKWIENGCPIHSGPPSYKAQGKADWLAKKKTKAAKDYVTGGSDLDKALGTGQHFKDQDDEKAEKGDS